MAGLKDVAKEVGLMPITTESGVKVNALPLLEAMFKEIIRRCKDGELVRIHNFGTFRMKLNKGRTLKTPLMEGGEVSYSDMLILKFRQSMLSKREVNSESTEKSKTKKKSKDKKGKSSKEQKTSKVFKISELPKGTKDKKAKRLDESVAAPVVPVDSSESIPMDTIPKKKREIPKKKQKHE
jgi:nucleoid DNA-binding protein